MPNNTRIQISITVPIELEKAFVAICNQKFLNQREAIKWAIIEFVNVNVNANSITEIEPPVTNGKGELVR